MGGRGYYGHRSHGRLNSLILPIIFLTIFATMFTFAGIMLLQGTLKYDSTKGVAVSNRYSGTWHYTTYEYTVDGKDYVRESEEGWELPEEIGKTVTIYYLKDNPESITEKEPTPIFAGILVLVVGVGVAVGVVFMIKSEIDRRKKRKAEETSGADTSQQSSATASKTVTCPYCGTRHSKNSPSCPSCGSANR